MSRTIVFLVGAIFIAYGAYAIVQLRPSLQLIGVLIAAMSVIGGVGVILDRSWSRYFIYIVSVIIVGRWFYLIVPVLGTRPYDTGAKVAISLLPGLFTAVICAGSSYIVMRHFRGGDSA